MRSARSDGAGCDDSEDGLKMKETREIREKKGRKQMVAVSRRKKRMGRMKSQPMKKAE